MAGTKRMELPVPTVDELSKKILGGEDTPISALSSTEVYGWLLEAGESGDLERARIAFRKAANIIDRLAGAEPT
jgi:hypothetical protein